MSHLAASNLKRSAFHKRSVGRRVCETYSDRFSADFQSVRARGNMRKTCKNHRCLQVFISRRFFERESPLERKSIEKCPKSTLRTPQIDQNRCPRAMLGRSRRPDGPPESILARSRRLDGRPETILARSSAPDALPEAILVRSSDPRGDLSSIEARGTPEAQSPNSILDSSIII